MQYEASILDRLSENSLFFKLNQDEMDQLLSVSKVIELQAGQTLFSQNEDAHSFYFTLSGKIKLYRIGPSGNEKVVEIINENEAFSEALMFMKEKRYPVTSEALVPSKVIAIRSQTYFKILNNRPELCFEIMGLLCVRLHQRLQEIERLSLQNAKDRLVHYLITNLTSEANVQHKVTLDIPKRVLASRLSMLPETFSRVLHKLADDGIIEVNSKVISINSVDRLKSAYHYLD
ncbi:MAG: Crp/Fnr family transcriptional regulator [Pseudomonadales bacterium]|nr:Crp/Fnr family transcriptional regulator [Pseudomonadales bacterium]